MKKINLVWICFLLLLAACNVNDQGQNQTDNDNENDNISSLSTNSNSENYPHTKPIKVQDAKYEFRTIIGYRGKDNQNPNMRWNQNMQRQNYTKQQAPNNNQQQNQETPSQEQNNTNQNNNQDTTQPNTQQPQQQQNQTTQNNNTNNNFVQSVIELTNAERQKEGLPALEGYADLSKVAQAKAQDMNQKGYFSHTSPTYGSPFDMMRDFGIEYQSAGENIAKGQPSPEEVVQAWMNSEGHRANILDNKFTHIGVGFDPGGNQWVQMFIKK